MDEGNYVFDNMCGEYQFVNKKTRKVKRIKYLKLVSTNGRQDRELVKKTIKGEVK